MGTFLPALLRLSLLGSVLAVLLLLLRPLLLRRAPYALTYYLWLLVLLRLCVPVGVTLPLPAPSKVPAVLSSQDAPDAPAFFAGPAGSPAAAVQGDAPVPVSAPTDTFVPAGPSPAPAGTDLPAAPASPALWMGIWALGAAICLGQYVWSYAHFSRSIRRSASTPAPEALALLRTLDPKGRVWMVQSPLSPGQYPHADRRCTTRRGPPYGRRRCVPSGGHPGP